MMKPRVKLPNTESYFMMNKIIDKNNLHIVCSSANCPNRGECWDKKTATFMILGDVCTRNCLYCSIDFGKPIEYDENEAEKIVKAVKLLDIKYAVITSVTRDDLCDGGASVFVECVKKLKENNLKVELLIPDYNKKNLIKIINSKPNVIGHNIEAVRSIFGSVRPQGDYKKSLELLKNIKKINSDQITKSGFMVGLGENTSEIKDTILDLRHTNIDIITIGQYLKPSVDNLEVQKYYSEAEFKEFEKYALSVGIKKCFSGPLVRSSYHAEDLSK